MRFKSIRIVNFKSMKDVSLNLDNNGLTLIQGENKDDDCFDSNGSGKSTLPDALCWVLTGMTTNKTMKADKVVNRKAKKNCSVTLNIEDDNGDKYLISRYRKHSTHGNNVLVYKNGVEITSKSDKDTEKIIQELLQMDYLTFTSSILYSAKSFKFTTATDSEMKKAFETMLGLEAYSVYQELSKEKSRAEVGLIASKGSKLSTLLEIAGNHEESIKLLKDKEKSFKGDMEKSIKQKEEEHKTRGSEVARATAAIAKNKKLLTKVEKQLESKLLELSEFDEIKKGLTDLRDAVKEEQHNMRSTNRDMESLEKNLSKLRSKVDSGESMIGENCPVCGSLVTAENLSHVLKEIKAEMVSLGKDKVKLAKVLKASQTSIDEYRPLIEEAEKILSTAVSLEVDVDGLKAEVVSIRADIKSDEKHIGVLNTFMGSIQSDIKEMKGQLNNTYVNLIKDSEDALTQTKKDITITKKELEAHELKKVAYDYWVRAFGNQGIKSLLLDSITPFLNERANYYSNKLTSGSIDIEFSTVTELANGELRDKFNIQVDNKNGGEKYESNSGGECKRVDLAVNMALQDLVASRSNRSLNIVFFDEVFDALDAVGCEKVVELLQENEGSKSSVFVITHNNNLEAFFDNSIKFIKENGYTRLAG